MNNPMSLRETMLLATLLVAIGAAVALYALMPAGRLAWLATISLGAPAAGLLLARAVRVRRPGAP